MSEVLGGFTITCRFVCSAAIAAPLLYFWLVRDGDVYHFLLMVLVAPVAGLLLVANSLYCLYRYRHTEPPWRPFVFLLIGLTGVLPAWYFLPQFRM